MSQGVGASHRHGVKLIQQPGQRAVHPHLVSTYNCLARLDSGDNSRVDEGFGPFGRVFDERLPLPRQPDKLLLMLVKVCVHAMLKVGWS